MTNMDKIADMIIAEAYRRMETVKYMNLKAAIYEVLLEVNAVVVMKGEG